MAAKLTYRDAGVDIDAGNRSVQLIKERYIDYSAAVDNNHKVLKALAYCTKILNLHLIKAVVTCYIFSVIALSCLTRKHVDGCITAF